MGKAWSSDGERGPHEDLKRDDLVGLEGELVRHCLPADYEFVENCGLNDFGDTVAHPFKECSPGYCNPNGTELCSQCNSGATAPTHMESPRRTHKHCRKVIDSLVWVRVCLWVPCVKLGTEGEPY